LENKGILIDIGTGPGNLAKLIAEKYPNLRVVGIDLSETMIKTANKNKKNLTNLKFKIMDGNNLEFEDNSVDYIISTFTLHHWRNPLKVLAEIHRVLKTDGRAWIYDGYSGATDEDIDKNLHYPLGIKIPRFLIRKVFSTHGFSNKEYNKDIPLLIKNSNFKNILLEKEGITIKITLQK
jgi:ubiquinone/menaquinone biosynthesis C-methylase UbiE